MLTKSKIRKIVFWFLVFLYAVQLAQAGEQITLSPDGSHSNQNQINEAFKNAGDSRTVILTSGEYEINGPIHVPRDITIKGEPGAKILVSKDIQSPWFSPTVGVVNCFDPFNIKISGIEIDGNCQNLPSSWASSPGHAHDQEQLIKIIGSSGSFGQNIEISNTVLHNSFGDGIQARFIDGIISKDNEIINTQHESIYYSACKNCKMINNRMAIITSDGGRFDNCVNGEAEGNIVWQYNGTNNNGAYKGGASAFQIGDAGSSKGYNGKKDWIHSTNIELHNNTIIDPGRKAFVVDAAGQTPSTNLFIHDNIVVGTEELEIMGIQVSDDISIENPPSVEMSEKVFSSIFDILDMKFTDSGRTEQNAEDIPLQVTENTSGIIAGGVKIVGVKDRIVIDNVSYIPDDQAVLVQTEVIQNPDLDQWSGKIKKIDQDVSVKIKNGTAYATLSVKTSWYTQKKDSVTGKSKKSKLKTSTATFTDSYSPVPEILTRPTETKGYINEYRSKSTPNTRVFVDPTGLQKIAYEYGSNTSTHTFLIGERKADETGIYYTNYSKVNSWNGGISTFDDSIIIYGDFDPDKLKVTCYTPYENFTVTDFEHNVYDVEKNTWISSQTAFILKLLLMLFCGYKMMRVIIPR